MATYKEYYKNAPEAVLKAVEAACEKLGREASLLEIQKVAKELDMYKLAVTPYDYSVFDFTDRLRRWLRQLVKKGRVLELGDRSRYYYIPAEGPLAKAKDELRQLRADIEATIFDGEHVTPDLPGELHDREL